MKLHVKKKKFKDFCRDQVRAGLINQADGTWRPYQTNKQMDTMMRDGYRIGRK